jgi:hypothetical protein
MSTFLYSKDVSKTTSGCDSRHRHGRRDSHRRRRDLPSDALH